MARSMRSSVVWRFGAVAVLASAILLALPIDGTDNSDSDLVDLSSDGSDASTAPATSVSPTTMPSVSPTTMPSVSPTTMPSVSPSASPAAPSAADTIYTVSSNISFSDLDISAFDDASFSASFEANFQSQLAAYAGVDATDVEVISIESGSVQVESELTTTSSAAAATLVSGLSDDVSAVFTDESFASYGTISALTVSSSSAPISSTTTPTASPSVAPSVSPTTTTPTVSPSVAPSATPTTLTPTALGVTRSPTGSPSAAPSLPPTASPSVAPSLPPTAAPTVPPTPAPTTTPSATPTTQTPTERGVTWSPTVDPCSSMPCYPGVICTNGGTTPGAAAMFVCGPCPLGTSGNGTHCAPIDHCEAGPCSELTTCTSAASGAVCGACPTGFEGDGTTCEDVDECLTANGGCTTSVACINIVGGRECGPCPEGYSGSGETRCVLAVSCAVDNGGCDEVVSCTDTASGPTCGPCPQGYEGDGAVGCADYDACVAQPCFAGVHCTDLPAPEMGFTCGACPTGFVGDGVDCILNACFVGNGGCDASVSCTNDPTNTLGRACGACGPGLTDVNQDGVLCVNTDGCAEEPCYAGVMCTDRMAPAEGRDCGPCPTGYDGDGATCEDVDECAATLGLCDPLTACVNSPGSWDCTDCPTGYKGSGQTGCKPETTCEDDNGGCYYDDLVTTTCDDAAAPVVCGPCPQGYEGSGDTSCKDIDGCAGDPCFPGVECSDVRAPGVGHTCAACPEGYRGDGITCTLCTLEVELTDSTASNGVMRRSAANQVVGKLVGLNNPACINTLGTQFAWSLTGSTTGRVALDDVTNKANTLRLWLPKKSMAAGEAHVLQLEASLVGNPVVAAKVVLAFTVQLDSLVPMVSGGGVQVTSDMAVALNAAPSYDPDAEPGAMAFRWLCSRSDGLDCRSAQGALLPSRMTNSSLAGIRLQAVEGDTLCYTFTMSVTKGARVASTSTTVSILPLVAEGAAAPPAVTIAPLLPRVAANKKLTLLGVVEAANASEVALRWTAVPVTAELVPPSPLHRASRPSSPLDLTMVASTPLDGINLVLKPDSLTCGAAYRFMLTAVDAASPPEGVSTYIDLEVNTPPTGGGLVCSQAEGYVLSTKFDFKAEDWQDDDPPLLYQLKYRVVGGNSTAWTPIGSPTPEREFSKQLPVAGLAAFDHLVSLQLSAKDNLEGVATSVVNVTVNEMMTEQMDDEEKDAMLGGLLASGANDLANGDVEASMVMVTGLAHMANADPEAEARRRRRRRRRRLLSGGSDSDAQGGEDMRGMMMGMVGTALSVLPPSMETLDWMAETAATVVDSPTAVSASTRDGTFGVLGSLVGQVNTTGEATMAPDAAASVTSGLNSLMLSMGPGVTGSSDSEEEEEEWDSEYAASESEEVTRNAAQAVGILNNVATSLVKGLAPGEAPQELVSDTLTAKVQNAGALDNPACPLFGGALPAAGGAGAVTLPSSLKDAGVANAGDAVVLRLVSVAVSPHSPNASNAANASSTRPGSGVLTIAMESASSSQPLVVKGLAEPIEFSLPMTAQTAAEVSAVSCLYWDEDSQTYSSDGCVAQPNPAPPGVFLYWKAGSALPRDVNGSVLLDEAWAIGGWASESDWSSDSNSNWMSSDSDMAGILEGCEEVFDAYFEEYDGADAGLRKFVGDGCELSRANNTAMCWWDWRRQTFTGSGCVLADTLQCMCTHLTDFQAGMNMGTGELKVPDVAVIDPGAMTSLSLADVMASGRLLTVVGTLIGAAVTGFILSNFLHNSKRIRILRSLVFTHGRDARDSFWFKELHGGVWTWNLDDEVEPDPENPTLQTVRSLYEDFKTQKRMEVTTLRRNSMRGLIRENLITSNPLAKNPTSHMSSEGELAVPTAVVSPFMQELSFSRTAGLGSVMYSHDPFERNNDRTLKQLFARNPNPLLAAGVECAEDSAGTPSADSAPDTSPQAPGAVCEATGSFASAVKDVKAIATPASVMAKQAGVKTQFTQQPSLFSRVRQALGLGPSKPPAMMAHNELQSAMGFNLIRLRMFLPITQMAEYMWELHEASGGEKRTEQEVEFSVERMLGTALVLACLDKGYFLCKSSLKILVQRAEKAPWVTRPDRDFSWHMGAFKALMAGVKGSMWQAIRVWQILLMQRMEGNWTITPALANVLRAGEPLVDLADNMPTYDPEHLVTTIPGPLLSTCMRHATAELAGEIWATLLALQLKSLTPFNCVINPQAPALAQVTMEAQASIWLDEQLYAYPPLEGLMDAVRESARVCVQKWTDAFVEDVWELRDGILNPPAPAEKERTSTKDVEGGDAKKGGPTASTEPEVVKHARVKTALAKTKRTVAYGRGKLMFVVRSHPLGAIAMSPLQDPFTRADKLLAQFNVFIVMLSLSVAFYYSKSVRCCEALVVHYACEEQMLSGDMSIDCMGYETCQDLSEQKSLMPDELLSTKFVCDAFPQSTLAGRVMVILAIAIVLVPVQMFYMTMFQQAGNAACAKAPGFLVPARVKMTAKSALSGRLPIFQAIAFGIYGFFFNMQKFNKAMAMMLFACWSAVFKIPPSWKRLVVRSLARMRRAVILVRRKTVRSLNKSLRRLGLPMDLLSEPGLVEEEWLTGTVKLRPPSWEDEPKRQMTYVVVAMMWALSVWVLLTYVTLIRAIMGKEAEELLINTWGLALLFEQFGKEGIKILLMKSFVNWANGKMMAFMESGADTLNSWYDVHLMRVAHELDDELNEFNEEDDMIDDDDFDVDGNTAGLNIQM